MTAVTPAARRVHIDTDPGLDDVLALALALASPELAVVSLTTVSGNASIEAVTENAQRFLALVGESLPVGRGAGAPMMLERMGGDSYHGVDGLRGISIPAIDRRGLPPASAVLRESLETRSVDRIVALGPLTNVAELLEEDPALFAGVEVLWMGGSLDGGNATPLAEFNCFADPTAAKIVLTSGIRVRIVGLDVTRQIRLQAIEVHPPLFGETELGRLCHAVIEAMMDAEEPVAGERRATLHDPAAVLAATPLDLFRWEPKLLDVVAEEGRERGRLYEEPLARGDPCTVQYAVEVRAPRVRDLFIDRLTAFCRADAA